MIGNNWVNWDLEIISMIPYFHFEFIRLGPLKLYMWGFFVSLGFLAVLVFFIKKYPKEKEIFVDLILYILIGAIVGARLFYSLFYTPELSTGLKNILKSELGQFTFLIKRRFR